MSRHHHAHAHPHQPQIQSTPSILRLSALQRLATAAGLIAALWAMIFWAMG